MFKKLSILLLTSSAAATVFAMPENPNVILGSTNVTQDASKMEIRQSTPSAIIEWSKFDVESKERVEFKQPNANSIALNRISDIKPSMIDGNISANGNIVMINKYGIIFGQNAEVNVNGLIASTSDITNQNFARGDLKFDRGGTREGYIKNDGKITAKQAGLVGLVAPRVENNGYIEAKLGKVHLANGDRFTVDLYGDSLLEFSLSENIDTQSLVNNGTIKADGGKVMLSAADGKNLVDSIIQVDGLIEAQTVGKDKNGAIVINSGLNINPNTDVAILGTMDVSGKNSAENGGLVTATAKTIKLSNTSVIDASGAKNGGEVKIGGDYQGKGNINHAETVSMDSGAKISVDSINLGNGGTAVLWSEKHTIFSGNITAKGGEFGGNGGIIETSSIKDLSVKGVATAGAKRGSQGRWLLDPADISITNANANVAGWVPTAAAATIDTSAIAAALAANTDVTITTGGDGFAGTGAITVSNPINVAGGTGNLTLSALSTITVNGAITFGGGNTGSLTLKSDNAASGAGHITINDNISLNTGNILIGGGDGTTSIYAVGDATQSSGVRIAPAKTVSTAGNITINAKGYNAAGNGNYGLFMDGGIIASTGGVVTINAIGQGTGNSGFSAGILAQTSAGSTATISNTTGLININAQGGGAGTGDGNSGFHLFNAGISSTTGDIIIIAQGGNNAGTGTASGNYGILVDNSQITSSNGKIQVLAKGSSSAGGGNAGISLASGSISTTGTGAVQLSGEGGSNKQSNYGISLAGASQVSTVNGDILIGDQTFNAVQYLMRGGSGDVVAGGLNYGLLVDNTSTITTSNGNIFIKAAGGYPSGPANGNNGVMIQTATNGILNSGLGTTTVIGIAGGGPGTTGGTSYGIAVRNSGAIKGSGGAMYIAGKGGESQGDSNYGVAVFNGTSTISNTGSGSLTVSGEGGGINNSSINSGIHLIGGGTITVDNGNLTIGTQVIDGVTYYTRGGGAGSGTSNRGLNISSPGAPAIGVNGTGNLDILAYNGNSSSPTTGGNVAIRISQVFGAIYSNAPAGYIKIRAINTSTSATTGGFNYGLFVNNSTIQGAGGPMYIAGVGGDGTGDSNDGMNLNRATISNINGGNITLSGQGGGFSGNSNDNFGINADALTAISANGELTIGDQVINGMSFHTAGGGAGTSTTNHGLSVTNLSTLTSSNGSLKIKSTKGNGVSSEGVIVFNTSSISTTGTGHIEINASSLNLSEPNSLVSAGYLTFYTPTPTSIDIGTAGTGDIVLPDVYFSSGYMSWRNTEPLTIGDQINAKDITIASSYNFLTPMRLITSPNGNIIISQPINSGVVSTPSGIAVLLLSGKNFINNVGAGAITLSGTPRWIIFSTSPNNNFENDLKADATIYSCPYGDGCPGPSGKNLYFYSSAPTSAKKPLVISISDLNTWIASTGPSIQTPQSKASLVATTPASPPAIAVSVPALKNNPQIPVASEIAKSSMPVYLSTIKDPGYDAIISASAAALQAGSSINAKQCMIFDYSNKSCMYYYAI